MPTSPQDPETIYAEDLMPGDVFPSHDGTRHEVERVDGDTLPDAVRVHVARSDGTRYVTTFAPRDDVKVEYR